jgi:hypothetical protein
VNLQLRDTAGQRRRVGPRMGSPINDLLAWADRSAFSSVSRRPGKAHRSLLGRWLVSLRATSLGPEGDAWIVVIEQFATSMCL